jgi:hypothetical protein
LETFAAGNRINHFKLNETPDFIETPAKSALKAGEPGYF